MVLSYSRWGGLCRKLHNDILYIQNLTIWRYRFINKYERYAIKFVRTFFICPYIHNNENTSWSTSMKILSDGSLVAAKIRNLSIKFIKNGLTILLVVIFELILFWYLRSKISTRSRYIFLHARHNNHNAILIQSFLLYLKLYIWFIFYITSVL